MSEKMNESIEYNQWYLDNIEPGIRKVVKTLRDRGINTVSSCEHMMLVEVDLYDVYQTVAAVDLILKDLGYKSYLLYVSWWTTEMIETMSDGYILIMLPNENGIIQVPEMWGKLRANKQYPFGPSAVLMK